MYYLARLMIEFTLLYSKSEIYLAMPINVKPAVYTNNASFRIRLSTSYSEHKA